MELLLPLILLNGVGLSIATAVLAKRKNRNPANWFLLSIFWGISSLIIIACSKELDITKGEYTGIVKESDSLAKLLWCIVFIPVVIILMGISMYNQGVRIGF